MKTPTLRCAALLLALLAPAVARPLAADGPALVQPLSVSPPSAAVGGQVWLSVQGSGLQSLAVRGVGFASTSQAALSGGGMVQSLPAMRILEQTGDHILLQATVPGRDSQGQPWQRGVAFRQAYVYLDPPQVDGAGSPVVAAFGVHEQATPALWTLACLLAILALVTWVSRSLEAAPAGGRSFNWLALISLTILFTPLWACTVQNQSLRHEPLWLLMYAAGALGLTVVVIRDFRRDKLIDFLVGEDGSYSLSLCQVLFWTLIVFLGTIYVWLVTGGLIPITQQILILLGITGASHITARAIDGSPDPGTAPLTPGLADLFTERGPSGRRADLSKLQMFLWTLITGLKLFYGAVHDYQWSDLSSEYLILIGVSNSLYVGSKIVAAQSAPAPVAAPVDDLPNPPAAQ